MSQYYGLFAQRVVCDDEFPGQGGNAVAECRNRLAQQQLPGFPHRAVRVRPADSVGCEPVFPQDAVFSVFKRSGIQRSARGATMTLGMPVRGFSRLFNSYTYEIIDSAASEALAPRNPTAATRPDRRRHRHRDGHHRERHHHVHKHDAGDADVELSHRGRPPRGKSRRADVHLRTVDNPFTPRRGMRITGGSGRRRQLRRNGELPTARSGVDRLHPTYATDSHRTARANRLSAPYGGTQKLPYYLRYFLGGENQIRGFDLRTVGPINDDNQLTGGNKFVLFNAEYYLDIRRKCGRSRFTMRGSHSTRRNGSTFASSARRAARTARRDAGVQHAVPAHLLVEQVSRCVSAGTGFSLLP